MDRDFIIFMDRFLEEVELEIEEKDIYSGLQRHWQHIGDTATLKAVKKELYQAYSKYASKDKNKFTQRRFTTWIKQYCDYAKLELGEERKSAITSYIFSKKIKVEEVERDVENEELEKDLGIS